MLIVCFASYYKAFGIYSNGIQAQRINLAKLGVLEYVVLRPFWSRILLEHVTWFLKIMVVAWILLGNETLYSNQGVCVKSRAVYRNHASNFLKKMTRFFVENQNQALVSKSRRLYQILWNNPLIVSTLETTSLLKTRFHIRPKPTINTTKTLTMYSNGIQALSI